MKAKAGMNRVFLEAAPSDTKRMLEYKTRVELIDPRHTSQACSACGAIDKASRRSQSKFECVACGHADRADENAAKNMLALGLQGRIKGAEVHQRRAARCPSKLQPPTGNRPTSASGA